MIQWGLGLLSTGFGCLVWQAILVRDRVIKLETKDPQSLHGERITKNETQLSTLIAGLSNVPALLAKVEALIESDRRRIELLEAAVFKVNR